MAGKNIHFPLKAQIQVLVQTSQTHSIGIPPVQAYASIHTYKASSQQNYAVKLIHEVHLHCNASKYYFISTNLIPHNTSHRLNIGNVTEGREVILNE